MALKTSPTKTQRAKSFQVALAIQLVVGAFLTVATIGVIRLLQDTANDTLFGWLGLSGFGAGAGAGALGLLVIILTADCLWLLFFVLWQLRRKMHLEKSDRTLRLP